MADRIVLDADESYESDYSSSVHSDNETEDDAETEEDTLRRDLADVPFEDLEVLEKKLGATRYEEVMFGSKKAENTKEKRTAQAKSELFAENRKKKDSRPLEMTSKQKPAGMRRVIRTESKVSRDPRFDDLSGNLNVELFKKSFSFLDDIKVKEKKALQRKLKGERNPTKKAALHKVLQQLAQREKLEKEHEERTKRNRELKKVEIEAIKKGKRPFYLKNSEKKKLELADKYKKLKESGRLKKYLSKKRKRNAAKERKYLPKKRDNV